MIKALLMILPLSAILGLAACSDSSSSSGAEIPQAPSDSSGAQVNETNKILGSDFKVGKALAIVTQIPDSEDSYVSVTIFEDGTNVTCETLFKQEPRTLLNVGGVLDLNKAVMIVPAENNPEAGAEEENETTPSMLLTADDDDDDNGDDNGDDNESESSSDSTGSPADTPAGYEKASGVANGTFITKEGGQDVATAGYLIVTTRTDNEISGIIAAHGSTADKISHLEMTEFVAEVCALPESSDEATETPEGDSEQPQHEEPAEESADSAPVES